MKQYLLNGLKQLNIEISYEKADKLLNFMDIVLRENKKINLTAIKEPKEFIEKHIIDSAIAIKYLDKNASVIDIGTGAGFPGIVLKIIREDLDILLLDSLNKRINYLNNTIKELGLTGINAIHGRAEELGRDKKYRESYDYATARAVANMNMLMEYTMPFVKPGGRFIAMKGSKGKEEALENKRAAGQLSGKIVAIDEYELPYSNSKREIINVKKIKPIAGTFPRKQAKIKNKPL